MVFDCLRSRPGSGLYSCSGGSLFPISSISSYCLHQRSFSLCFFHILSLTSPQPLKWSLINDHSLKVGSAVDYSRLTRCMGRTSLTEEVYYCLTNVYHMLEVADWEVTPTVPFISTWSPSLEVTSIIGFLYPYSAVEHVSIQRFSKSVQHGSIWWYTTSAVYYQGRSLRGSIRYRRKGSSLFLSSGTVWSVRNQPQPFTTEMRLYSQFPPTPTGLVTPVTQQR